MEGFKKKIKIEKMPKKTEVIKESRTKYFINPQPKTQSTKVVHIDGDLRKEYEVKVKEKIQRFIEVTEKIEKES